MIILVPALRKLFCLLLIKLKALREPYAVHLVARSVHTDSRLDKDWVLMTVFYKAELVSYFNYTQLKGGVHESVCRLFRFVKGVYFMDKDLISTKEAAELLGVSSATLKNWRTRKLFGCEIFPADEKHGNTWYYERERVEQLKEVYHKGVLQNMYKLAKKFAEKELSDNFQKRVTSRELQNLRHIILDVDDLSKILGITARQVQKLCKADKLKWYVEHDGSYWFTADNVYKFQIEYQPDKSSDDFQKSYSSDNIDFSKDRLSSKIPDELGSDLKTLEGQLLGMLLLKEGQVIPD